MEKALTGSVDGLLNLGVAGIAVIGLAFVVWRLWKAYDAVQEKRIAEARESVKALESNTSALEGLTEIVKARLYP